MSEGIKTKAISIDSMKLRDLGNSIGFTVSKEALDDLGLIDDDGQLIDDINARSIVYDDGRVEYEIPLEDYESRLPG